MAEKFGLSSDFVERAISRVSPFIETALNSRLTEESLLAVVVTSTKMLESHKSGEPFSEDDCILITRFGDDSEWEQLRKNRLYDRHDVKWDFHKRKALEALSELAGNRQHGRLWFLAERGAASLNGITVSCAGVSFNYANMFAQWICAAIIAETYNGP